MQHHILQEERDSKSGNMRFMTLEEDHEPRQTVRALPLAHKEEPMPPQEAWQAESLYHLDNALLMTDRH